MRIDSINSASGIVMPVKSMQLQKAQKREAQGYTKEVSNVYYKPNFGRTWAEHKSWGAVIDKNTKEASFKIFTFPDTELVTVTVEKNGDEDNTKEYVLKNKGEGVHEITKIPSGEVEHGDKYYYTIYRPNQEPYRVKDPYSFRQEQLLDKSTVYDHSLFNWTDDKWSTSDKKISRLANGKNGFMPLSKAKIYELNTASFTNGGTFKDVKKKLNDIKQEGFNTIEIMPVENTYSFNWGYDGVDKFAPAEHLGGPDQLKDLINFAHKKGLNVIMDMVPNHLGPDGSQLGKTGPYLSHSNNFGDAFNFEWDNKKYVRDYMVNAALNWVDNYHCDGLRLDMTKFMESDYTMKQIAAEINYHKPDVVLIAEDGRDDKRVTSPLNGEEYGANSPENVHADRIQSISNNEISLDNLGFDSQWAFDYYHKLKDLTYNCGNLNDFENAVLNSQRDIKYIMSHDEIGNFDGTRLVSKLMVPMLYLNENMEINNADEIRADNYASQKGKSYGEALSTVRSQKSQLTAEKLAKMLQTGELDKYKNADYELFYQNILKPLNISHSSKIHYDAIQNAYNTSYEKNKMALALTYAIPGPKMVFQGDEKADLTPFRFFRQFDSIKHEDYLYVEKGYQPGKSALNDSKLGNILYSREGKIKSNAFKNLTKDLNDLIRKNSAMSEGYVQPWYTVKHHDSKVMGINTKDLNNGNELFIVSNFNIFNYPDGIGGDKYYINFPEGEWREVLNTNDQKYGGNGKFMNTGVLQRDEEGKCAINLNSHSTLIFKRVK